jgi:hypothetical protein
MNQGAQGKCLGKNQRSKNIEFDIDLKRQCQTVPPTSLIHGLKLFCICLHNLRENRDNHCKVQIQQSQLRPWDRILRSQWDSISAISALIFSANTKPYAKLLQPVNHGPRRNCFTKKECQKSRDTVLLKSNSAFVDTHQTHSEQIFFPLFTVVCMTLKVLTSSLKVDWFNKLYVVSQTF